MVRKLSSSLPLLSLLGLVSCSGQPTDDQGAGDVAKIVYAVRQHTGTDAAGNARPEDIDVAGGMGQVMDYGRYHPGGRLEVLDLRTAAVTNLIAAYPEADVSSVDVSYDGTRVLFTMKRDANDSYHVYWASLVPNADNTYEIHQLTFGQPDDINAVYTPGGRIVFVTNQAYTEMGTRADEYNHSARVTQLGTITEEGGDADRKLCSQNLSHIVTLFSMSDGRVGFSRWEHLENVNDVKMFAMNPDCTQMVALGGQHGKPGNSLVQVTEDVNRNVFFGIVTERENTIQAGALFRYDARSAADPARIDEEKDDGFSLVTPDVPTSDAPSPVGRYRSPSVLPDGRLMVSWADGEVNEDNEFSLTPPDYGIYIYNRDAGPGKPVNSLIVNYPETWEVYARPVTARAEPQAIPARQDTVDSSVPAILGSIDVRETSLYARHGETVSGAQFDGATMDEALSQATKVRIIEGFSSEGAPGVTMFGLTMAEGAAMLGEARVHSDGSWLAEVPPYVPVHLQPVDRFDLSIRSQTTWIQGMPGESRVCGGCHEDRTSMVDVSRQMLTIAAGSTPDRFNTAVAERVEYPWWNATAADNPNEIQKILDQKCVSCHNGTTNGDGPQEFYSVTMTDELSGEATATYMIPRLDLSSTLITVTYDNDEQTLPMSYVSLFYPAALSMEMGDGAMVEGNIPPRWAVPSDARGSKLIEKLNVTAENDAAEYAWTLGTEIAPDAENGGTVAGGVHSDHAALAGLTREELVKLIRAIDMGGQYYARQNTDFQPYANDPVGGGSQY
ncbi:MAG TPA: hypothetical protein VGK73_37240 [Polyangiaceae bacterium]